MIYILLLVIDLERWYKLVKITINTINFAEVILNVVVCYYGFLSLIIINSGFFHFKMYNYYTMLYFIYWM